ncbi:MAG: S-methyl-5-thioribose-1-phosphate isomerase [Bacillota bacterium]|nr:S-methyl-5-thioribose-1-phosphate isomerase [Bacillota bacterium]
MDVTPLRFKGGNLEILDQTRLPREEVWLTLETREDVWEAIHWLKVRGAPAIGVAAAYGLFVAVRYLEETDKDAFIAAFRETRDYLNSSRPTAVNLSWALERMEACLEAQRHRTVAQIKEALLAEAQAIHREDEEACRKLGENGLSLLSPGMGLLTHCNAGALAASRYGTALAPIHLGQSMGYGFKVFAGETRPLLQGARLTAWELQKAGVDVTLICDNMAASVMKNGWVDAVLTGCDRLAANGDGANKIGTSGLAILAKEFGVPFYMFVPTSTIDRNAATGADIPIEQRRGDEVHRLWYARDMAPAGIGVYNPAFDVTEAKYITAIVTERGIVRPPYEEGLRELFG